MKSQIFYHLKYKFILNPFFIILFFLIIFFNFGFPIIVFEVLKFEASTLFNIKGVGLFYLISYCWLGVLWAVGTVYYLLFSFYQNGYIHGLLELKYRKKQVLMLLFCLILFSSLVYILQVGVQTLILSFIYQDEGFTSWYTLGAILYSLLIFALIYSSIFILKILFKLSTFVIGIIILGFTAILPIISTTLTAQTGVYTIDYFREENDWGVINFDNQDLMLGNYWSDEQAARASTNQYKYFVYFDFATQLQSIFNIFNSNHIYKKIKSKKLNDQQQFEIFNNYGAYGLYETNEPSLEISKYLLDYEFLKAYDKKDFMSQNILTPTNIELLDKMIIDLQASDMPFEIHFEEQKFEPNWSKTLDKQLWIYKNITKFLIFNLANNLNDFNQDFFKNYKVVVEINKEGYDNFVNNGNIEDLTYWENNNFEQETKRIILLDRNTNFDYQTKDYPYQISANLSAWSDINDPYGGDQTFAENIWNLQQSVSSYYEPEEAKYYLKSQTPATINQYFNFLNALFYFQQNLLSKKLKNLEDLDKLTTYDNLFLRTAFENGNDVVAGINKFNFNSNFWSISYENLYPLYPFIIFWIFIAGIFISILLVKFRKINLL